MNLEKLKAIGLELKAHREAAGISLQTLSNELKIRRAYLHSIEEGIEENLPSNPYVIGYVKQYANYLNLEPTQFILRLSDLNNSKKLSSGASLNLITSKEFIPDIKIIVYSLFLLALFFILIIFTTN